MSIDTDKQVAKELTLAVAAKMEIIYKKGNESGVDSEKTAEEIAKAYKIIYAAVKPD